MVSCPFGKASLCFPLSLGRSAALGVLDADAEGILCTDIVGYTTRKTFEAGAHSLRLTLQDGAYAPEPGAHLVVVRAKGCEGFLPGLAAPRCGGNEADSVGKGMEVVIFGRSDKSWSSLMYLPEDVLQRLFPTGSTADLRFVKALAPVQHDCPPQWLRDRLLRLADGVETTFACPRDTRQDLQLMLERAGLLLTDSDKAYPVGPADEGQRVGEDELGYWNEEMKMNTRCGASIEGGRQDVGLLPSFPGIEGMY
mmetsp:Transcript_94745/g.182020  ORF Transcript_94745/g.182020 Transcript_94745/m.182020 type:complete len:253 (-) Transcript_94745:212-970(-)